MFRFDLDWLKLVYLVVPFCVNSVLLNFLVCLNLPVYFCFIIFLCWMYSHLMGEVGRLGLVYLCLTF